MTSVLVAVAGSAVSGGVGASTVLIADQKYMDTTSTPKPVVQRRQSDIKIEEITADGTTRTVMRLSQGQLLDEPFLGSSLDSATMELEKESPSRLTVPGTVGRRESFSRRRSSASNITPLALPPRPAPLNRNTPITPDIVRDRINQLINQNAAIMEMPKADAPRPKRMSRQNSENLYPMSRSNSDVSLIGSPASLLPDTSSFSTPKSALPSSLTASEGTSPPDSKGALSAHMHRAFSLPEAEIQKQTQKLHKQLAQKEKEKAAAAATAAAAQQQEQQQQVALETNRIQQLVQVAKMASGVTGVKAGTPQEVVTGVKLAPASHGSPTSVVTYASGGGGGGAGTPLPQEIKIQIKLPKPGQTPAAATATVSTVHTQQMIGQPTVLYPPPPTIPFGSPPPGPVTIPLGGVTLTSTPVGQPAVLQPLGLVSDNAETIYSQQQTLSVGPNDGHAIKELLLRDRRSSLQPSGSHDTPLVVIDPPPQDDNGGANVHVQTIPAPAAGLNVNSAGIPQHQHHHHEMRSMSVDSVSLSMGIPHLSAPTPTASTTPTSTPAADIRFSAYDPLSPPRRGRPIGIRSKSEGLISPLVLGESPTTIETSGSKTSVQVSPGGVRMRMPVVPSPAPAPAQGLPSSAAVVSSPGGVAKLRPVAPATSRPQLKLMIPQPGTNILQGPTSSATPTPSNDAASPYLSPSVNSPLLTPGGGSTTPGGAGGTLSQPQTPTTPSQFAKLKLKGKLLMKRSMSIEKMERERAALGAGAGTPTPGAGTDVNPFSRLSAEGLQRSASIDETKLSRNNKRLSFGSSMMESPSVQPSGGRSLGRALSAQGNTRRLGRLGRSLSIHEEPEEIMMAEAATTAIATATASQAVVDKSVVTSGPVVVAGATTVESVPMQLPSLPQSSLIIDDKTLATKLSLHLFPVPVNKGFEFFKAGVANMAPYFKHSFSQSKDAAPLLVNAPIKLVTTASDISRQESKSSDASSTSPVGGITVAPSVVSQMSSESSTPGGETPTSGGGAPKPPGRLISDENGAGNGRLSEKAQVGHDNQGS